MIVDLSTKELKAASTAFTVAMEIAKERLGQGDCVEPGMLLRGLTTEQLDELVRIMRQLENGFDELIREEQIGQRIAEHGGIAEIFPPSSHRRLREQEGGYRDE